MSGTQILFVDDDANILSGYRRSLHNRFEIVTCLSAEEGLKSLTNDGPFAVVVADMKMPRIDGIQFLQMAEEHSPDTVRLMLTGNADQQTAADAVNRGHVFSFLTKPCPADALAIALNNALKQHRLIIAEKELLEQTLKGAIKVLTEVLSMQDPEAFGRSERLRNKMRAVAEWFRAPRPWELEVGAMLSQIGYVTVPPTLLIKSRAGLQLTGAECDVLTRLPQTGATLLENIPRLGDVSEIVRYQRKNFDGSGFPIDSTAGEEIPIGARILRVLTELLDAEAAEGSRSEAFCAMRRTEGVFDPQVLEAVAACFDIYLDDAEEEPCKTTLVRVAEINVNTVLAQDISTREGALVVPAGTLITPPLLQKLRNFSELGALDEPIAIRVRET